MELSTPGETAAEALTRPAPATTGHPFLDRIAPVTHYGFYVLILMMVGYAWFMRTRRSFGDVL